MQSRNPGVLEKMIADGLRPDNAENCGNFEMRIARDGTWYHQGAPIRRMALVKLFATVLRRDDSGDFWLVTPVERGRIDVDDAPFTAVEMQIEGKGRNQVLNFRTNLDHMVRAGEDHPVRVAIDSDTGEPTPYILVRDNLEALITRPVFYDLVALAEERDGDDGPEMVVWSNGVAFVLGSAEDDTVEG